MADRAFGPATGAAAARAVAGTDIVYLCVATDLTKCCPMSSPSTSVTKTVQNGLKEVGS